MKRALDESVFLLKDESGFLALLRYCLYNWYCDIKVDDDVLKESKYYKTLYEYFVGRGIITVAAEVYYVDREYRDSYYLYYARKHSNYERFALRICLFQGDLRKALLDYNIEKLQTAFVGSCVFRPLEIGMIGRTLIAPRFFLNSTKRKYFLRTANYHISLFGMKLTVEAFPYMMQDVETITCAEVTVLNMLDYFSTQYNDYRFILPSDINRIISQYGYERVLPSKGINYEMLTKVLSMQGFSPKMYMTKQNLPTWNIKRTLHRYVDSGIPIAVEVEIPQNGGLHSVVCIGYGRQGNEQDVALLPSITRVYSNIDAGRTNKLYFQDLADACNEYVIMDDNQIPYKNTLIGEKIISTKGHKQMYYMGDKKIIGFTVPLHSRMIMDALEAEAICLNLLAQKETSFATCCSAEFIGEDIEDISEYNIGSSIKSPIILRFFLASASTYRKERVQAFSNKDIKDQYALLPLPHFVWVCEIFSKKSFKENKIIGEIVLDGTSSAHAQFDSILLLRYPYRFGVRYPGDNTNDLFEMFKNTINACEYIQSFSGNLFPLGERNKAI